MKYKEISSLKSGDKLKIYDFDKIGMFNQFFLDDGLPEQLSSESTLVSSRLDVSSCDSNDSICSNVMANDNESTSENKSVKLVVEHQHNSILSCSSVVNLIFQITLILLRSQSSWDWKETVKEHN